MDKPIADTVCVHHSGDSHDNSVICSVPVRTATLVNFQPKQQFELQEMKILNMNEANAVMGENEDLSMWGSSEGLDIMNHGKDGKGGMAAPYITGYMYNIHWGEGIDWDHALLVPSLYAEESDPPVILRFNYTEVRELFEIKKFLAGGVGDGPEAFYPQAFNTTRFLNDDGTVYTGDDSCLMGENYMD